MTYHYRIYTFQNGLGETVFRAKPVHRFWPQWATGWVKCLEPGSMGFTYCSKWGNRDGVTSAIKNCAKGRASAVRIAKRKTLKLVITEDVPVEVL